METAHSGGVSVVFVRNSQNAVQIADFVRFVLRSKSCADPKAAQPFILDRQLVRQLTPPPFMWPYPSIDLLFGRLHINVGSRRYRQDLYSDGRPPPEV